MEELQIINDDQGVQDLQKLEHQIEIARKFPRDWDKMVHEVARRATKTKEVATECFYSLPRGGKTIEGPGVRFAELILASYDNIRIGTRIAEVTNESITAECIIYDLQSNKQFNVRETKSIVGKHGKYTNDMIVVTGKAATAIAKRNCIFSAVPMVEFEDVLRQVKEVASGKALSKEGASKGEKVQSLEERRDNALAYFKKLGIDEDRVLWTLKLVDVDQINEDALEVLVGLRTAIKDEITTINEAFPPTPKQERDEKSSGVVGDLKANKRGKSS